MLAPVVKLADGRRLHVVGSRGAVPAGQLVAPADVEDPELGVEAWIDEVLAGSGRRRTHPIQPVKLWSLSAVARVTTDGGDAWFKAPCEHFRAEARVHPSVASLFPDLVPTLIAVEETEGWLLMEPMVGAEDEDRADGADLEVATRWAAAQIEAVGHVDDLVAGGCRRRGMEETLAGFRAVLADSSELALLSEEELGTVRGRLDEIESLVREFWAAGIPDTLAHGDLHLGNVAWDGKVLKLFDWTDGCVSHPFLDASHLTHFTRDRPGDAGLEWAYAERWRAAYPHADIGRVVALAPLVDRVFQAITFDDIVNTTEPQSRWELGGVVADILRTLPEKVAEVG
jgi:hypothetical protein